MIGISKRALLATSRTVGEAVPLGKELAALRTAINKAETTVARTAASKLALKMNFAARSLFACGRGSGVLIFIDSTAGNAARN